MTCDAHRQARLMLRLSPEMSDAEVEGALLEMMESAAAVLWPIAKEWRRQLRGRAGLPPLPEDE